MKILQIVVMFYPSVAGQETYVLNLGKYLSQRGHTIDILTYNTENVEKEEHLNEKMVVYRCKPDIRYQKGFVSYEFIKKLLQAKDYDIYHVHIPLPFGLETAIAASRLNRIPLIAQHHGELTKGRGIIYSIIANSYSLFSRRISFRYVRRLIFFTRSYCESLGLSSNVRKKISIIRSGIDIQMFSPLNDGAKLRIQLGLSRKDNVLLFVGSLGKYHRYKGIDYLINALQLVKKKDSSIKLVIVGGGELIPELKQLAQELNLLQDIIFTGSIPYEKLPPYYAMCDVFVLPSIYESFGLVLQEAMASGKPCIASDLPGVRDNMQNRKTGLTVPPGDIQALAQAILLLVHDETLRCEMARNARQNMENNTWEKSIEQLEQIYEEAISDRSSPNTRKIQTVAGL